VSNGKLKSDCKCIVIRRYLLSYREKRIFHAIVKSLPRDDQERYLHPPLHTNTNNAYARQSLNSDHHYQFKFIARVFPFVEDRQVDPRKMRPERVIKTIHVMCSGMEFADFVTVQYLGSFMEMFLKQEVVLGEVAWVVFNLFCPQLA